MLAEGEKKDRLKSNFNSDSTCNKRKRGRGIWEESICIRLVGLQLLPLCIWLVCIPPSIHTSIFQKEQCSQVSCKEKWFRKVVLRRGPYGGRRVMKRIPRRGRQVVLR